MKAWTSGGVLVKTPLIQILWTLRSKRLSGPAVGMPARKRPKNQSEMSMEKAKKRVMESNRVNFALAFSGWQSFMK